jgi:hypothetical protein
VHVRCIRYALKIIFITSAAGFPILEATGLGLYSFVACSILYGNMIEEYGCSVIDDHSWKVVGVNMMLIVKCFTDGILFGVRA